MRDPLVAVCPSDHPLASRSSVTIETLSNEIFVDLTRDRALRRLIDKVFAQQHLKRTTAFEVRSDEHGFEVRFSKPPPQDEPYG